VPNVFRPDWDPREGRRAPFTPRLQPVGREAGARELGASLFEIDRGESIAPLHAHHANEEMLVVLAGTPTLRTLDGTRELEPGQVVAFPRGRAGAHRVDNHADEPARVLIVSTMNAPEIVEYPDSGKLLARTTVSPEDENHLRKIFRADSDVGYFDGET
jgi:uncharacterized cupin superfamily protein